MIAKCELTYIQLATSISQSLPVAQAWTAGSTNRPQRALEADHLARVVERRRRRGRRPGRAPAGRASRRRRTAGSGGAGRASPWEEAARRRSSARDGTSYRRPRGSQGGCPHSAAAPARSRHAAERAAQREARAHPDGSARAARRRASSRRAARQARVAAGHRPVRRPVLAHEPGPGRVASSSKPSGVAPIRRAGPSTGGASRTSQMRQSRRARRRASGTARRAQQLAPPRWRRSRAARSGSATQRTASSRSQRW